MIKIFITLILLLANISTCLAEEKYDEDEFAAYDAEFSSQKEETIYDPYEKINRKIFTFNDFLDRHFLEPITKAYNKYIPNAARKSVKNFTTNLTLPISAINSFAQGKVDNALATTSHFIINSTLGVAGLFDIASSKNIQYNFEDFGQTFGYYGAKGGPYLMLPLFGPSNLRDFSGFVVNSAIDPLSFNVLKIGGSINAVDLQFRTLNTELTILVVREGLIDIIDDVRKDSFDVYATIRSGYIQQRNNNIKK